MREIKFRAWIADDNPRWHKFRGPFIDFGDSEGSTPGGIPSWDITQSGNITLCQYIGLKDKNGMEIYEGDVVPVLTKHLPIIFENGSFGLRLGDDFADLLGLTELGFSFEVIGNIYENPELVK